MFLQFSLFLKLLLAVLDLTYSGAEDNVYY